jgi:hypothetical protein
MLNFLINSLDAKISNWQRPILNFGITILNNKLHYVGSNLQVIYIGFTLVFLGLQQWKISKLMCPLDGRINIDIC